MLFRNYRNRINKPQLGKTKAILFFSLFIGFWYTNRNIELHKAYHLNTERIKREALQLMYIGRLFSRPQQQSDVSTGFSVAERVLHWNDEVEYVNKHSTFSKILVLFVRSSDCFSFQGLKQNKLKQSFSFSDPQIWIKLLADLRSALNLTPAKSIVFCLPR